MSTQVVNIFFAYTDDSNDLINIAKKEVDIINRSTEGKIQIRIQEWKTDTISAMGNPEAKILEQMPITASNFFIGLFRFKYGSPSGNTNPDTGKPYQSGMEEEFFTAYRLWTKHKRPEILIFKSIEDVPRKYAVEYTNQKALEAFFKEFSPIGKHPGLYKEYRTSEQFGEIFRQSILSHIFKSLSKATAYADGCSNIFFDKDNVKRNSIKRQELQCTKTLRLQANTGYSFLVPGAAHSSIVRNGLARGMEVKIIIQNPLSVNAVLTLLRRSDFNSEKEYTNYLKNQLPTERLINIYRNSHWFSIRLKACIDGYKNLKKTFGSQRIQLRFSNRDLSNSILLTDNYLFFEPYFGILEMDTKDISVFEVQVSRNSTLYTDTATYFNKLWATSDSYAQYIKKEKTFEEQLRNYFGR